MKVKFTRFFKKIKFCIKLIYKIIVKLILIYKNILYSKLYI